MKLKLTILLVPAAAAFLAAMRVSAGEPQTSQGTGFSVKPSAVSEGKDVRIRFAAAEACDAEVTVLAADGREVRHLAAGLLGEERAAAPLVPGKLAQSLLWDRTDDRGRPVGGGEFSVRVRLGMRAAGARPVLEAKPGDRPTSTAGIITEPDPGKPGIPGISAEEVLSEKGAALANRWRYGWHLMADREDDRLYATHTGAMNKWYRYMGSTGKAAPFDTGKFLKYGEYFRIGPGGEIHVNPVRKLTRDLKEIPPLEGVPQRKRCNRFSMLLWHRWRAGPFVEHWRTGNHSPEFGLDGRCYMYITLCKPVAYFAVFDTWERKRVLREGFQPWLSRSGKSGNGGHFACLRVDTGGRVYIAAGGNPKGTVTPRTGKERQWYRLPRSGKYGSIVRIKLDERWMEDFALPMGAPPKDPEELKKGIAWSSRVFVPRIDKCYPGVMSWLSGGCTCSGGTTFDLDEHGRLYVPDCARESLVILDNEGNEVLRLGKTVPAGADGKGAAIHVGWPHRVACTRRAVYFGEDLSRRVIRVALGWAAEEKCAVK